ncbi:IMP dehydrogenase, partial [Micrococcus endophyticus]|uniref:IMP dehydrogenase n=1 Tax=Micrococcus endophyticus TaxID=455343 RepID=UPI0034CDF625
MRFLTAPTVDLTYNDVFLVPSHSEVTSRLDVDIAPDDGTGGTIPLVSANMTAVTGRRMVETMARRGGLGVLPQDIPVEVIAEVVRRVKAAHPVADTALTVGPQDTVLDLLHLVDRRNHGAVCVVDGDGGLLGVVRPRDCEDVDRFASAASVMHPASVTLTPAELGGGDGGEDARQALRAAFERLHAAGQDMAPVVEPAAGSAAPALRGVVTAAGLLRSSLFTPSLDDAGRLRVGAALGVNGAVGDKAAALVEAGVDVLVVDTAHGHQQSMLDALAAVRALDAPVPVVAGNVVSADGVRDLVEAGADIVKVGVGP